MDPVGSLLFIEHYKKLFNIEKESPKAEMLVIKNCPDNKIGDKLSNLKSIVTKKYISTYIPTATSSIDSSNWINYLWEVFFNQNMVKESNESRKV